MKNILIINAHLPEDLESDKHFFYEERFLAVDGLLPKNLRGVDGPLAL
jgi:hypothetical protein